MTLTFTCDLEFAILHVVFGSVTVTEINFIKFHVQRHIGMNNSSGL